MKYTNVEELKGAVFDHFMQMLKRDEFKELFKSLKVNYPIDLICRLLIKTQFKIHEDKEFYSYTLNCSTDNLIGSSFEMQTSYSETGLKDPEDILFHLLKDIITINYDYNIQEAKKDLNNYFFMTGYPKESFDEFLHNRLKEEKNS